jgi:hypothetical protein
MFCVLVAGTALGLPLLAAAADRLDRRLWPPEPG